MFIYYYWLYWIAFDLIMAVTFLMAGFWFYRSKGEGCRFLVGFYDKSQEERDRIDEEGLCRMYGIRFMCWAIPFIIAAPLDILINGVGCIFAWFTWVFMFGWHLFDRVKREITKEDEWW